jgi:hypothetical protein
MLPLLVLAAGLGAVKAWDGPLKVIGFALAPLLAVIALGIHIYDIARTVRARVQVLAGEVLGRFPDDYDERTIGFDIGRKREFLVDAAALATLEATGRRRHLSAHPQPRRLRATRRMIRSLRNHGDVVLLVVNDRIFDRAG